MFSENGLLFNNADLTVAGATALNQDGTAFPAGRGKLSRNTQFAALVQKADANRELTLKLLLSLDGGTNYRYTIAVITVPVNYKGQWAEPVAVPEFIWEKYTSADIMLKVNASAPTNAAASDWDKVQCYLGEGEPTIAGRLATADTVQA